MGFTASKFRKTIERQGAVVVHIDKRHPDIYGLMDAKDLEKGGLVTIESGAKTWKVKPTEKALLLWGVDPPQ